MLLLGGVGAMGAVAALMRSREAAAAPGAAVVPSGFPPPPRSRPQETPIDYEEGDPGELPMVIPDIPDDVPPRTSRPKSSRPRPPQPRSSATPNVQVPRTPSPRPSSSSSAAPPSPLTPVIGPPFRAGKEDHNAQLACARKDLSHPNGRRKKSGQKLEDWLTDLAYWETYLGAPLSIDSSAEHEPYRRAWLRIREHVRACLRGAGAKARASAARETEEAPASRSSSTKPRSSPPPSSSSSAEDDDAPASEITTEARRTIGHPFREGDREHNAKLACDQGGLSHPSGRIKKSGQSLEDWYTDVAYWETYPDAPQTLTRSASHRPYVKAWLELRELVRRHLATKVAGVGAVVPSRKAVPRRSPEAVPNQQPTVSGAGAEARNVALVLVARPRAVRHGGKVLRREPKQKLVDWLTYAAFWVTYPEAPQRLDPKGGREQRNWYRAWVRIQGFVARGLRLLPKLGTAPPLSFVPSRLSESTHAANNWRRWALALSFKSKLRTVEALRSRYRQAATWLSTNPRGLRFRNTVVGRMVGGQRVTMDGLLGEVAQWFAGGIAVVLDEANRWPKASLTKAYFATNGIWDRRMDR